MQNRAGTPFVGIDACHGGWVAVQAQRMALLHLTAAAVHRTFAEALSELPVTSTVAVDIPIGLMEQGFRSCDTDARKRLGPRWMCVFPAPPRPVLRAQTYPEAKAMYRALCGQGLTRQAFGIMPKIAEVDRWMQDNGKPQDRVFEVHPELCFWALNGQQPVIESKHSDDGLRRRYSLLKPHFPGQDIAAWAREWLREHPRAIVKEDDVLDAIAACFTAATWSPEATIGGPQPAKDTMGLRMEMRCSGPSQP